MGEPKPNITIIGRSQASKKSTETITMTSVEDSGRRRATQSGELRNFNDEEEFPSLVKDNVHAHKPKWADEQPIEMTPTSLIHPFSHGGEEEKVEDFFHRVSNWRTFKDLHDAFLSLEKAHIWICMVTDATQP